MSTYPQVDWGPKIVFKNFNICIIFFSLQVLQRQGYTQQCDWWSVGVSSCLPLQILILKVVFYDFSWSSLRPNSDDLFPGDSLRDASRTTSFPCQHPRWDSVQGGCRDHHRWCHLWFHFHPHHHQVINWDKFMSIPRESGLSQEARDLIFSLCTRSVMESSMPSKLLILRNLHQ